MAATSQKVSTLGEIQIRLAGALKSWNQQTSGLIWPEGDTSMAAMDVHMTTLRAVNAQLKLIEGHMPPAKQKSLAVRFDAASVQDPGKFARFAEAVEQAIAA